MIVGFLGTGRIAAPMVRALARGGHDVLVSERNRQVSTELAASFDRVTVHGNHEVVQNAEVVFLCLVGSVARRELGELPFRPAHRVISVMAEFPLAEIRALIGDTRELCVTVPMPFIDAGGCPLPVFPGSMALEALFGHDNEIMPVAGEAAMMPHFAATAVTSTLFRELMVARDWLGRHTGDTAAAERYLLLLESGYLRALAEQPEATLADAIGHLATAGGLNARLLTHMENAGTMEALAAGLENLLRRQH